MDTWNKLCEANVNHYHKHPKRHIVITVAYTVVAVVWYRAIRALVR